MEGNRPDRLIMIAVTPEVGPTVSAAGTPETPSSCRYMRAIGTRQVCTLCHGSGIAPEVAAVRNALYPKIGHAGSRSSTSGASFQ
ncbi:MAG: hypothetical protein OXS40_14030 [Gammaproteobacteria bacterium]|nr:hypothetical protein [Gammaproteobacteria bacterium]